ncbi:hypothetical protein LAC1533_2365 [Ligilactobacillus acidipiscis]|uniref:Uncharacterized protein n=1 Tax=Ligilactobacillus acidipiscis TaxID=89059 RepID=A0A1K1KS94_9LACO|nr:hypothetical protein LAC1533_2365 [Ligilactobacillus acidipiscis]
MVTSLLIRDIQKSTTNGFFISNLILQTTNVNLAAKKGK